MTQVRVVDVISEVAQVCRNCPGPTLVQAYVRAARRLCNKSRWLRATVNGATTAPVLTPYTTGTVTVTNNSQNVVGAGTAWLTNAVAGDSFTGPNAVAYTIEEVTSNTALKLTALYAGPTLAAQAYSIGRNRYTVLYSLGSDTYSEIFGIIAAGITESTTDVHALTEGLSSDWETTDAANVPEFYQYVTHGQMAVHPKPDQAYPLSVVCAIQPKRGVNSLDDTLLLSWDYALQAGALAYLLKIPGMPWTDKAEANTQELLFLGHMNQAVSDANAGNNAGALASPLAAPRSANLRTKILTI